MSVLQKHLRYTAPQFPADAKSAANNGGSLMKRIAFCVLCLIIATAANTYADIARPSPSPAPGKIVLHTSMIVVPDKKAYAARLEISQESLNDLRDAIAGTPASASMTQRIANSSTRTIIAGLCLFLSLSLGGVWLMRSAQARQQKMIVVALFGVALLGAAAVITQANAGPPPSYQWRNLSQNLSAGKPTYASVDIQIMPEGSGMKLVVPVKNQ